MKKNIVNKTFLCISLAFTICLSFYSCKKNLTIEERRKNLENTITTDDCKEITSKALQTILKNLKDINFETVTSGVQEDIHTFSSDKQLYIQIVVSGSAKGVFDGKDSLYYFYLYGRIPETLADKKEFDENGYNFSLKNSNGLFVYSNKESVDSLNKEKIESKKISEEMKKKDFSIGGTKVKYWGIEENSLVYSSSRDLIADEITDAVQNKIKSEGVNMIRFYNGSKEYANYIYKTQCIIFMNDPAKVRIYKIIGGTPVEI